MPRRMTRLEAERLEDLGGEARQDPGPSVRAGGAGRSCLRAACPCGTGCCTEPGRGLMPQRGCEDAGKEEGLMGLAGRLFLSGGKYLPC